MKGHEAMSKLMSVAYTTEHCRQRVKHVTRRRNWWLDKNGRLLLNTGDTLALCPRVRGLAREALDIVAVVKVDSLRREPLRRLLDDPGYGAEEMTLEGFPGMDPAEFIRRYFTPQRIGLDDEVTRIQWTYVSGQQLELNLYGVKNEAAA